jgi:phage gpG-like protein
MIKQIGDFDKHLSLKEFKRLQRKLPLLLGNEAKNHFVGGFRLGGGRTDNSRGGWKPRQFSFKRNKGRAVLTQSGDLRRSIQVREKTFARTVIGTSGILYAQIHNEGGEITITPKMRRFFRAMMFKSGAGKGKSTKLGSAGANEAQYWRNLARHKGNKLKIPKREFIGDSGFLLKKLNVIIVRNLNVK